MPHRDTGGGRSMKLRLSHPAYSARLAAFLEDLGQPPAEVTDGVVELACSIPAEELAVYLRVWSVLEPEVTVTVD
jgi:hypothetical protein